MSKQQGDGRPRPGPQARVYDRLAPGERPRPQARAHDRYAPGELKPQVYLDERPAELFDRYHEWARTHEPDRVQDLARLVMLPLSMSLYRVSASDCEHVPGSGPAIVAPNHFSAMDHFFCGIYLRRRVRFMAKSQLFKGVLAGVLKHAGAFPVRRGQRDEQAIATALAILAAGGVVVIYPEGGRSRDKRIAEHARPGVGRLALESGAPVVPVAIHGSQQVRGWRRLRFPRVQVAYGPPLRYAPIADCSREQQQAAADEVLAQVRALYDTLSASAAAVSGPQPALRDPATR